MLVRIGSVAPSVERTSPPISTHSKLLFEIGARRDLEEGADASRACLSGDNALAGEHAHSLTGALVVDGNEQVETARHDRPSHHRRSPAVEPVVIES
jgi:hypothetical protein